VRKHIKKEEKGEERMKGKNNIAQLVVAKKNGRDCNVAPSIDQDIN